MSRRPPTLTLFPYTTLFRSGELMAAIVTACGGIFGFHSISQTLGMWQTDWHAMWRQVADPSTRVDRRSEEHTSELQSLRHLVCRLLLEKKNKSNQHAAHKNL